jgi:hypothetical protein
LLLIIKYVAVFKIQHTIEEKTAIRVARKSYRFYVPGFRLSSWKNRLGRQAITPDEIKKAWQMVNLPGFS